MGVVRVVVRVDQSVMSGWSEHHSTALFSKVAAPRMLSTTLTVLLAL